MRAKSPRKSINSRQKGARGELELADELKKFGFTGRRGQQFSGGTDSPDVVSDLPFHIEVKRVEAGNPYKWMAQAKKDAAKGKKKPIVCHKKNHQEWIVIISLEDFLTEIVCTAL